MNFKMNKFGIEIKKNKLGLTEGACYTAKPVEWFRFDSVDEKMYEKMNGISGSNFQKALKTVAMLSQIFPSHVYPQFTRMNANEEQLESFYRF